MKKRTIVAFIITCNRNARRAVLWLSVSIILCSSGTLASPGSGDTGEEPAANRIFFSNPFDSVTSREFLSSHAFTLDNFLEGDPFYVVSRMGPIGAEVGLSRYGIGRGRCGVYLEGIRINDPQNDIAPFAFIPMTSVNGLTRRIGLSQSPFGEGIEGDLQIIPPAIPDKRPSTFIELSKGTNNLKQRRVRFSSVDSRIGLDLAYDELLNGGYQFDSRGLSKARGFGSSSTRIYSFRLRGAFPNQNSYGFSFKQFNGTFQGDIDDPRMLKLRSGHIAVMDIDLGSLRVRGFSKGYSYSSPDSLYSNETFGLKASRGFALGSGAMSMAWAEVENIVGTEAMGSARTRPRLNVLSAGNQITYSSRHLQTNAAVFLTYQFSHAYDVGGRFSLMRKIPGSHLISISLRRNFRLPNLGELFLPRHLSSYDSTLVVAGNSRLRSEHSWELNGAVIGRIGPVFNEVRLTAMRISGAISSVRGLREGEWRIAPVNGGSGVLEVIEDRFRLSKEFMSLKLALDGGIMLARNGGGALVGSIPKRRLSAGLSIGRALFKPSSAALLTVEYEHSSARDIGEGMNLPGFDVMNVKLDVTLLDAHLYAAFLNVLDEEYRTFGSVLMTPRTFVYGVQWTLFE